MTIEVSLRVQFKQIMCDVDDKTKRTQGLLTKNNNI